MESRPIKAFMVAASVVLGGVALAWLLSTTPDGGIIPDALPESVSRTVPADVRIRVEVLNASDVRGLARQTTLYLRDKGFDVVRYTGVSERQDSVLIFDRTNHPEWAEWASDALGGARIDVRPDTSLFVDLTIVLGAHWRLPPKTFYP